MEEERRTEVIHSITYADGTTENSEDNKEISNKLEGVDLDNAQEIADYYMAKNNIIDPDLLEVEKKEKELREEIEKVVDDKNSLIEYLTNLHASIEVMEERIYELELKSEKKEKSSIPVRPPMPGMSGKGLSQLPFGIF